MGAATALWESHCPDHTAEQWRWECGEGREDLFGEKQIIVNVEKQQLCHWRKKMGQNKIGWKLMEWDWMEQKRLEAIRQYTQAHFLLPRKSLGILWFLFYLWLRRSCYHCSRTPLLPVLPLYFHPIWSWPIHFYPIQSCLSLIDGISTIRCCFWYPEDKKCILLPLGVDHTAWELAKVCQGFCPCSLCRSSLVKPCEINVTILRRS